MPVKVIVRKKEYEVRPGLTVKQAIQQIGLQPESYLALKNGEMAVETETLQEGDQLKLVAVIAGGSSDLEGEPSPENDPFPPSEFDQWAGQYDQDVVVDRFPFTGYPRVLDEVVRQADARAGMSVLDLGAGTGNLTEKFLVLGCDIWATDFSSEMLKLARAKFPAAHFYLHDLRQPFPPELSRRFDRIVSAYVFHHFELSKKVEIVRQLASRHLAPGGRLVIADLSFPSQQALNAVRLASGDDWDEELYWIASDALPALEAAGLPASYTQISSCAGIYQILIPLI